MKRILLLACVLLVPCVVATGQTNTLVAPASALPCLALNSPAEPQPATTAISLRASTDSVVGLVLLPHSDQPLGSVGETPQSPLSTPFSALLSPADSLLHSPPEWKWNPLPARTEEVSFAPTGDVGADSFHSSREESAYRTGLLERLDRAGLLNPPGPKYDSEVDRLMAAAFRPKIIHLGHAQFTCSIITAIARKNPFCLLDPSFIRISF